jgi:hypothetical protein
MLNNAEVNSLYILRDERELHVLRQDKEDVEYQMVLRWLENRIRELETQNA